MEGLSAEEAAKLVGMGMGFLCNALRDPNTQVRHTTAWTIGEACHFVLMHHAVAAALAALSACHGHMQLCLESETVMWEKGFEKL